MWERTALSPVALDAIRGIQQEARDEAAVARARLRAEAATEETRLTAVTEAGARVARVQAKTAQTLSSAWSTLETARAGEETIAAVIGDATRVRTKDVLARLATRNPGAYGECSFIDLKRVLDDAGAEPYKSDGVMVVSRDRVARALTNRDTEGSASAE